MLEAESSIDRMVLIDLVTEGAIAPIGRENHELIGRRIGISYLISCQKQITLIEPGRSLAKISVNPKIPKHSKDLLGPLTGQSLPALIK